jgi:hypothetical protein
MKNIVSIILFSSFSLFATRLAGASTVNLIYSGHGLMDENMAYLQNGDMIQLIYSPDATIGAPNASDGMPTGNDVLWESITASGGNGSFSSSNINYDSSLQGGYVYIRFFNSSTMGTVTYYGLTGLHQLQDNGFGFDLWDVTPTGAYWWTEYPFIVIPEPPTWLVLLPAGILGILVFRKREKKNKHVNNT